MDQNKFRKINFTFVTLFFYKINVINNKNTNLVFIVVTSVAPSKSLKEEKQWEFFKIWQSNHIFMLIKVQFKIKMFNDKRILNYIW